MSHKDKIGELVKKKRHEAGLTVRALSEKCVGSERLVKDICFLENGKTNMGIDNLFLIFEKLNIDLSKLYNQ